MKLNYVRHAVLAASLAFASILPATAHAASDRTVADESIYDLLVDRFNDGNQANDEGVNPQDPYAFSGGDFEGVAKRLQHIIDMGFTIVSLGPVFDTETYDGSEVTDYGKMEPHFGTEDEFHALIKEIHKKELKAMADFPLGIVGSDHVWAKDGNLPFSDLGDGKIAWDPESSAVQDALREALVDFVTTYDLDGIRLTKLEDFSDRYLNELIASVKEAKPGIYVMTNEESEADFDSKPDLEKMRVLRQSFVEVNPDSSGMTHFSNATENEMTEFDDLLGSRFTYDIVEKRMFPPTRWKLSATALFTLPGVPTMPYGTEIAVNGKEAPESHPIMNFKTDMELKDLIGNLNSLRNQSETLRKGKFELLYNEHGYIVYKRSSDKETWIISINNTDKTADAMIPADKIGANKKLRGLLDGDLIRESKDGIFRIVQDRETAEVYIADEDKGFNTPYLIATILVFSSFLVFLIILIRRGRKTAQEGNIHK